ncbi:MAG: TRAP transporter small permease, partial [Pseudomonadota bacterium]|nr:TRAP transporter small permease [Pseudomonadota bacterium]
MAEPAAQGSPPGDPFALRIAATGFAAVAAALLFAMMIVTTIDVVGRYVFAQPLPGASEISQI